MNLDFGDTPALLPFGINDSFMSDLETIVLKVRHNIIVKNFNDLKQYLFDKFGEKYSEFLFVEIDIFVDSVRGDCVDQILKSVKDAIPTNENIKHKFELLYQSEIPHIQRDEIFYSIFEELMLDKNHVVLIIENFNRHAYYISDNDYHRLIQLYHKKYKNRLSFIIISDNINSIKRESYLMNIFLDTFDCKDVHSLNSLPSENIEYNPIKNKIMNTPEIYISYAWSKESEAILEALCIVLDENRLKYYVDKKEIDYKDNIREFEDRLGKGDYIILIISDKFLKSMNCMYEMLRIKENGDVYNRIFPIVLKDAKIYDPEERIDYIIHWEQKKESLNKKLKLVGAEDLIGARFDIDNISKFRVIIDSVTSILREMNTLSVDTHTTSNFEKLINSIKRQAENTFNLEKENDVQNERSKSFQNKTVNQFGHKSVYIEKNEGNVNIS
jgi:hypothetical protein